MDISTRKRRIQFGEYFMHSAHEPFITFTQIPQPMHSSSDSDAIFEFGLTSMHNLPIRTTGHDFLHSWRHRFGLHLSSLTIAIRVCLSVSSLALLRDILQRQTRTKEPRKNKQKIRLIDSDCIETIFANRSPRPRC